MTELSVNINKIALLRNQRDIGIPSVAKFSKIAVEAGAYGITVHPRSDQRHVRYSDVYELREIITAEFNIEGNPFTGRYMELMPEIKPTQATLVPDDPHANTSDHGWNLQKDKDRLVPIISQLKKLGIRVSLFMDPDIEGIKLAGEIGADRVELYTEPYAAAFKKNENLEQTIKKYVDAANTALELGLELNAGHDLNLHNLGNFCTVVPGILEVSIGHALMADALEMGLFNAVKEYVKILTSVSGD